MVNRDMLEAAKRLIQLGKGEEVEEVDVKVVEGQDKKQKRRSLVDLVMSPSRIFTAEKQFGERAEEDSDSREPEIGVRKFTPHSTGRRRRRLSLRGKGRSSEGAGNHRSCPDLAALASIGVEKEIGVFNTMSPTAPREAERSRQSWLLGKLKGRRGEEQGVGEEDMVDTVDTNTASVFGRASLKTQLIDINFE